MDHKSARNAALGAGWVEGDSWEFISGLTAIGDRMSGSPGERRAAAHVAEAFETAGLQDVHTNSFDMSRWDRGETELRLTAPTDRAFDAIALPYSPAGQVSASFVDAGYGTPDEIAALDVSNKIVVASTTTPSGSRFVHRMEKFGSAVEAGAVGFVFVNHKPGQLAPTGSLTFGEEAAAVAGGVSAETGDWLREYAMNTPGQTGQLRLAVEATTEPAESQNVHGTIGPDTNEEILLTAHYDAHDIAEGALDNGCGIATVVAAARVLVASDPQVRVRVVATGSEEVGLLGAEHLADSVNLGDIHAVVNVDGAGRYRDLQALVHSSETLAELAADIQTETHHPVTVEREPHPFSDQWPFVRQGVPALQLHSDSEERGRGWGHTTADTRDKVDVRNIREHGMLTALCVLELGSRNRPPRLETDALVNAFRDADFETGMRAAGLWPAAFES